MIYRAKQNVMLHLLDLKKHMFIWFFNAPDVQNVSGYLGFIEKTIKPQSPDHLENVDFFELVKT